jgi:hypothetical protein
VKRAAVAIFAKSPVPGRVKTRLTPPLTPEEAAGIARACLEDTLRRFVPAVDGAEWSLHWEGVPDEALFALAASLGVRVVPQADGDLGARLRSAFHALGADGADAAAGKVLAIGSDSPTLDPAWIHEAIDALDANDVVLGPAEDGGYYLIGTRSAVDGVFEKIPWSTPDVTRATLERAAALGLNARLLPAWYDIDDMATLRRAFDASAQVPALARALHAVWENVAKTGKGEAWESRPAPLPRP